MNNNFVELKNISKVFPNIVANDNVSIDVKNGEIYAILGENGAGKSTLMSVLFGLYEPSAGSIHIKGEEVKITSPLDANRLHIGMVHQHFKLVDNQSIAENIILGIEPITKKFGLFPKINIKKAEEDVALLSKKYHLEVNPTDLIKDVSVSTRQRVEILKMLYRDAQLLIFDEPTAVLTPQEIESLLQIIKSLRDSGKTIIIITHKLDEIKKIADRCAILRKGKLIDVLDVETTTTKQMSSLMVGHDISLQIKKEDNAYGEDVLRVENISAKNSDRVQTLNNISFKIRSGEILAVAGVSGNGQVELADAITGLLDITEGQIYLSAKEINKLDIRERIEEGIAYIPEDRHNVGLLLDFTLAENLCLKQYYQEPYCSDKGVLNFEEFHKTSDQLIKNFDIRCGEDGYNTVVRSMSGGNQQKAIIAREIHADSKLVIFVQPTRGLDVGAIEIIHKRIAKLRNDGKAILLISLELDEVMSLADTILVIYNGEVQTIRDAKELSKEKVGEYMMGVHTHAK
jgi:simple sugar transport system ATP-binding protein